MREQLERVLRRFGTDIILIRDGESTAARGFFQAVRAKSWQNVDSEANPLGLLVREKYTCILPGETKLRRGDVLRLDGREFLVRRAEPYYCGGKILYRWGLCVEKGGDDTWGRS